MRKKDLSSYLLLFFLIIVGFFTRFYRLNYPPKVVFDEAHFGLYATKYLSHQYYFDIHPPAGKLILGFVAFLSNIKPGFDFAIAKEYGDFNFLPLRATVAFFGTLFVILIYFLVREMGFPQKAAFLAAFFVLFDNAILVQSRLILLDIILLFFIFLSLFLYILEKKVSLFSKRWYFLIFSLGLSLGITISIKLMGWAIFALIFLWEILEERLFLKRKREILIKLYFLFLFPLLLYLLIFIIHLKLLPYPCQENCGQVLDWHQWEKLWPESALQPGFRDLISSLNNPPSGNLFQKIFQIHKRMAKNVLSDTSLSYHFYWEIKWYSGPFMIKPILYFWEKVGEKAAFIYFLGNPLVWWLSGLGFLVYFYLIMRNFIFGFKMKLPPTFYSPNCRLLFLGYLFFFFPFGIIPRFLLLYHYLPALTFSIIIFAIFLTGCLKKLPPIFSNIIFLTILLSIFLTFLYFLPFSYGLPLTESGYKSRIWLESWGL